jgi:hypothetical protein
MVRDMDLVRRVLLAVEATPPGWGSNEALHVDGCDPTALGWHVALLVQARYLEGVEVTSFGAECPSFLNLRLTWEGHEFLDTIRHDTVWQQLKAKAAQEGGNLPIVVIRELGTQYLKKKLGLD